MVYESLYRGPGRWRRQQSDEQEGSAEPKESRSDCDQDDGDDEECNGGDPMYPPGKRIRGYETPDGSFAQFCRVQSRQPAAGSRAAQGGRAVCPRVRTGPT